MACFGPLAPPVITQVHFYTSFSLIPENPISYSICESSKTTMIFPSVGLDLCHRRDLRSHNIHGSGEATHLKPLSFLPFFLIGKKIMFEVYTRQHASNKDLHCSGSGHTIVGFGTQLLACLKQVGSLNQKSQAKKHQSSWRSLQRLKFRWSWPCPGKNKFYKTTIK